MATETKKKANSKSATPKEAKPISVEEKTSLKTKKEICEKVEKKPKKLKTKLSEHTGF